VFDHVTIRVSDRAASERFYTTVLGTLGVEPTYAGDDFVEWANDKSVARGAIDHVWIRVADVPSAKRFYESIAPHAAFRLSDDTPERVQFRFHDGSFSLVAGPPAEHVHLAFAAPDNATVDAFHGTATEAGYRDNGPPGERAAFHPGYYGAYVHDPDGNNVEAVSHNR
jgi:catechol 2,3-dioxygenase-like lactoylglutathione lyase family enzyme